MAAEGPASVSSLRCSVSFSPWPLKALGTSVLWSSEGLGRPAVGDSSAGPLLPKPNRPTSCCKVTDLSRWVALKVFRLQSTVESGW